MDLKCILFIANSNYVVKTPKDDLPYILQFLQKMENFDMFPSKREISGSTGRTGDNLSIGITNGSLQFKMEGLEHIVGGGGQGLQKISDTMVGRRINFLVFNGLTWLKRLFFQNNFKCFRIFLFCQNKFCEPFSSNKSLFLKNP